MCEGRELGEVMGKLYEAQINGAFDESTSIAYFEKHFRKHIKKNDVFWDFDTDHSLIKNT